jgi:hypothetical protein
VSCPSLIGGSEMRKNYLFTGSFGKKTFLRIIGHFLLAFSEARIPEIGSLDRIKLKGFSE